MWQGNPFGRTLHFGIREHAMGAIGNGIALEGHTRPYVGTFLVFSDYMRPAVRMAAIMGLPVVYVWTHDSIGVGEDGPTHQPIEHARGVARDSQLVGGPTGDANETVAAWRCAARTQQPDRCALLLTRQNLPVLAGTAELARDGVARGGYVLADTASSPDAVDRSPPAQSFSWRSQQRDLCCSKASRHAWSRCPAWSGSNPNQPTTATPYCHPSVRARVAVEAAIPLTWWRLVGDAGEVVGIDHYGASADAATLFEKFGFTSRACRSGSANELGTESRMNGLAAISELGVSVWLDDLGRHRIESGELARLIAERNVVGVTTNPSIFAAAVGDGAQYADQIATLTSSGADVNAVVRALTVDDVQRACDVFADVHRATNGKDGRVSLEVDPRLAGDTDATVAEARALWQAVDRPNLMIKIPGTPQGLPAISVSAVARHQRERHARSSDSPATATSSTRG